MTEWRASLAHVAVAVRSPLHVLSQILTHIGVAYSVKNMSTVSAAERHKYVLYNLQVRKIYLPLRPSPSQVPLEQTAPVPMPQTHIVQIRDEEDLGKLKEEEEEVAEEPKGEFKPVVPSGASCEYGDQYRCFKRQPAEKRCPVCGRDGRLTIEGWGLLGN